MKYLLVGITLLFTSLEAMAHRVPFDEKAYLKLTKGAVFRAHELKNFCTSAYGDDKEKECLKTLESIKSSDLALFEAATRCGKNFKFRPEDIRPMHGIWNTGYYAKSPSFDEEVVFDYGPLLTEKANALEIARTISSFHLTRVGDLSKEDGKHLSQQIQAVLKSNTPWHQVDQPNSVCFADMENCISDESWVPNKLFKGKPSAIPKLKPESLKIIEGVDRYGAMCWENEYRTLTNPERAKIYQNRDKREATSKMKYLLIAEQEICDAAYFKESFCKNLKENVFPNLRIIK